jgi:putative ABC transport system ATP-binding protein
MSEILKLEGVTKTFTVNAQSGGDLTIFSGADFTIKSGEKVAIIGPSGSGKSTLLSLIGLLDSPSSGEIFLEGDTVGALTDVNLSRLRNEKIGFIFQSFELIAPFTVRENINAPLEIGGVKPEPEFVESLINTLGLAARANSMPGTLSGGEKQRVAIARALVRRPALILADEPTGSLDRATGEVVLDLLLNTVSKLETTLIIITHDESIAKQMDRVFVIRDKAIHERI